MYLSLAYYGGTASCKNARNLPDQGDVHKAKLNDSVSVGKGSSVLHVAVRISTNFQEFVLLVWSVSNGSCSTCNRYYTCVLDICFKHKSRWHRYSSRTHTRPGCKAFLLGTRATPDGQLGIRMDATPWHRPVAFQLEHIDMSSCYCGKGNNKHD